MRLSRKLSYETPKMSRASLCTLACIFSNTDRVSRCHHQGLWIHSRPRQLSDPSLSNSNRTISVNDFNWKFTNCSQRFSTTGGTLLVQAKDPGKLSEELQNAIDEHRFFDAWVLLGQHMQMEGFPRKSIVNRLLSSFAETQDSHWLDKAYGLVEQAFEEHKQKSLETETLIYLSLGLAKCGSAVPASTILRKLIEMGQFPSVSAWSAVLAYMSQTSSGAYLASELVLEIGYMFQDGRVDPRKRINEPLISMKPNTFAFNIALAGCLLFDTSRKAEQLLDMMPRVGIKPDGNLLIAMAHIYEMNGRIEELKKLRRHIDEAHDLTDVQFRQFYNCLLSCHLKCGDIDSASFIVLEMLRKAKIARNSIGSAMLVLGPAHKSNKPILPTGLVPVENLACEEELDGPENLSSTGTQFLTYDDFIRDRNCRKLEALSKEILDTMLFKLRRRVELISTEHGILQPTEIVYVKLVRAFLEADQMKELVEFLIKAEKEDSPASADGSALVHVINSCIAHGWLDKAHDILDEVRLAGIRTGSSVYASLLKAYCKENRKGEVVSLLKDARKAGVQLDASCYETLIQSRIVVEDTKGALSLFKEMQAERIPRARNQEFDTLVNGPAESCETGLMTRLLNEIKDGQSIDKGVHDWNNMIHFFCKKRLMSDAEKALGKMRSLGHSPNAQTFHSLVTAYAATGGKYLEITELWGEMKVLSVHHGMKFDQELLDSVLYMFVRGGFFIRANEVVELMEKGKMFVDKYKYRMLFLKYHKTLYKGKTPKFQTESQLKKREAALSFKKWVGLF